MKPFFKKGQVVLFQGDSITDCGRDYADGRDLGAGYAHKVAQLYETLFENSGVTFLNRGISGNRTIDVLGRYEQDIRDLKPDFISIMIGINDVWRHYDSDDFTPVEQFEQNYRRILQQIKKDLPNTGIMMIEPFLLHSLADRRAWHEDFDPKLQTVRRLAEEFADYYMALDGIMAKLCICEYQAQELAEDGVHPTTLGHGVIAKEYLKTLGVL